MLNYWKLNSEHYPISHHTNTEMQNEIQTNTTSISATSELQIWSQHKIQKL